MTPPKPAAFDCPHLATNGEHAIYKGEDRLLYCYHCQLRVEDMGDKGHAHTVLTLEGEPIEIDDELVPIISELWRRGIHTTSCCQGDLPGPAHEDPWSDYGFISFASSRDAEQFMDLVSKPLGIDRLSSDDGLLLVRAARWPDEIDIQDVEDLPPLVLDTCMYTSNDCFHTTIVIRFPNYLIPNLTAALNPHRVAES